MTCQNHIQISDLLPTSENPENFILFLFKLPKYFYHQIVCIENPMWHWRSWFNYENYDKKQKDWIKQIYKVEEENKITIQEQKKEIIKL